MHQVSIIILNWNNAADTLECLESVFQLDYPNYHVLVVDNGSTDDSVAEIKAAYPDLDLMQTRKNLGYAEGNNVGIHQALLSQPEYTCILNNDTVVTPGFLSALVSAMETDDTIGMAGPKTLFFEPCTKIFSAGCNIDWRKGEVTHRGFRQHDVQVESAKWSVTQNVDALAGCGVLVRRQAMEIVGLLEPTYFLNFEDIDWCVRMTAMGFRIRYVPEAVLYHKISATLGQESPTNTYYMTRNALRFFARYGPYRSQALANILLRSVRTATAWTLKPAYKAESYRVRRNAILKAIQDFALGRSGSMRHGATPKSPVA